MTTAWRDTLQRELGAAYDIRQELGGGGMSATYVAEETALGRSVVLKVLAPHLAAGLNVERFQREVQLAARLQHAFIVPLLAAGIADGQPWYSMPLVQGESLRARLSREGSVPAEATARILRDVAEALAYAHVHGVVHRDVKPDNILLSGAHALVADFGVAKALAASTGAEPRMTDTGLAIGTPAYMAPEQAAGDPSTDHRADLYALGVTAYEMLTGRPIFGARSPAQMLVAHAVETPESLSKVAPATPPELTALVHQLLAKHPNDRPARAQDVAEALAAMLARWTSGTRPPASRVTLARALALWGAAFAGVTGVAWLAVRWLPVPEWTFPAAVLLMLAGVPVLALTAWLHRPARPIAAVPTVASSTTVGRIEAIARPHLTWQRARLGGVVAVALLALTAGLWAISRILGIGPAATLRTQGVVAATDRVFVADIDSPSDTTLGSTVSELLRAEIARSASIQLVDPARRARALLSLGRPTSTLVGTTLAPDVARRANAKVFVRGAITPVAGSYLLHAVLVETATGAALATFRQSARSSDDLLRAVDRMGREIRDKLGASLREIRAAPPLAFAVTPSIEAASYYSRGVQLALQGDQRSGAASLERAVQVDTEFAMAYRAMAAYLGNIGDAERAAWAAERAFRYRAKLPPPIRLNTEATYYMGPAAYDRDRAIAVFESVIEQYPDDAEAPLNNIGHLYRVKRDFERSLDAYRRAVARDSTSGFAPTNIVSMLWATGRTEEARRHVLEKLPRWIPGSRLLVTARATLATAELKPDTAERVLTEGLRTLRSLSPSQRSLLLGARAAAERTRGRLAAASADQAEGFAAFRTDSYMGFPISVLYRAEMLSWDRQRPVEARRLLDSAYAAHPPGNASALGYRWTRLASAYAFAGDTLRARELMTTYERRASPAALAYNRPGVELAHGWIAMATHRHADAIAAFRRADVGSCLVCAVGPLAYAFDVAGQRDSAIATYERYLATRYYYRGDVDDTYLAGSYKRLGELYEARGDLAKARSYYLRFVDLWREADPELQPAVAETRRRLAALGARKVE